MLRTKKKNQYSPNQHHGGYNQVKSQIDSHLKVFPYPEPHHIKLCARKVSWSNFCLIFSSIWYLDCFVQNSVFLLGPHTQEYEEVWKPVLIMTRLVLTAQCPNPPPHAVTDKDEETHRHTHTHKLKIRKCSCTMFEVLASAPSTIKLFD